MLPADILAATRSPNPQAAILLKFSFLSETMRVFTGFGKFKTLDGQEWEGVGDVVSIEGLSSVIGANAPPGRIVLNGASPENLQLAAGSRGEYEGRPLQLFLQLINEGVLTTLLPLGLRLMTTMDISRRDVTRTITLNHESIFINRNTPAASAYSDRDQQYRFPGDRGLERMPLLVNRIDGWPNY